MIGAVGTDDAGEQCEKVVKQSTNVCYYPKGGANAAC